MRKVALAARRVQFCVADVGCGLTVHGRIMVGTVSDRSRIGTATFHLFSAKGLLGFLDGAFLRGRRSIW